MPVTHHTGSRELGSKKMAAARGLIAQLPGDDPVLNTGPASWLVLVPIGSVALVCWVIGILPDSLSTDQRNRGCFLANIFRSESVFFVKAIDQAFNQPAQAIHLGIERLFEGVQAIFKHPQAILEFGFDDGE